MLQADISENREEMSSGNKPWFVMGNFNEILDGEKHSRFSHTATLPPGIRDFQRTVLHCSFMHLGGHGPPYTWCKKRDESFICKIG